MNKLWYVLIVGIGVGLAAVLVFLQLPFDERALVGVEQDIPEDAAPPPGVSRFVDWNVVLHRDGIMPRDGSFAYGGQTIRLRLTALDFGDGDGWTFEIPGLDVSERVVPGEPVRIEITPRAYNNYQVISQSGMLEHRTLLRVAPPERE